MNLYFVAKALIEQARPELRPKVWVFPLIAAPNIARGIHELMVGKRPQLQVIYNGLVSEGIYVEETLIKIEKP